MTALGPLGGVLVELGAVVGALVVVLGAVWRLASPHVRAFVAEQSAAARQLQPDSGESTHDRVRQLLDQHAEQRVLLDELSGRLGEAEARLAEHLTHAATELAMLRTVCAAAGVDIRPRPPTAPRRRWYDDPDPAVVSWEVRRVTPADAD